MPIALNEAEQKEVYRKRQRDLKAALDKQACCMMQHTRLLRAARTILQHATHNFTAFAACKVYCVQHAPGSTHQAACTRQHAAKRNCLRHCSLAQPSLARPSPA